MKERVVVAMSGGVDSSVTAALVKEAGYDVIGMTLKTWPSELCENDSSKTCCSVRDVEDARSVARILDIPFHVVNVEEDFKKNVIDYFIEEYAQGRTPHPCIQCNDKVKFLALWRRVKPLGARYIATGHYARVGRDSRWGSRYVIKEGVDSNKDQSYVLFGLSQEQLSYTLFPVGGFTKQQVRQKARELGLRVFDKADSQEICFIPNHDTQGFLKKALQERQLSGRIVDKQGNVLGTHSGIFQFTIGQREGLGINRGKPSYVIKIEPQTQDIVVGDREDCFAAECVAEKVNWQAWEVLAEPVRVQAKIRYKHPKAAVTVFPLEGNQVRVVFDEPQNAVTQGQAIVFYEEETVLGGGWILNTVVGCP